MGELAEKLAELERLEAALAHEKERRRQSQRQLSARSLEHGLDPEVLPQGSDSESVFTEQSGVSSAPLPFATLQAALTELQTSQTQPRRQSVADMDVQRRRL